MVGIYVRQSLEKKDSLSLDGQVDFCKRQLLDGEKFEIYRDSGFSGKNIKRPDMERMLKDIENGIVNKVICYKLDRISRSILDFNNLLELFKKHKVEFVSCTENLDTTSPMGRAMTNIVATFAQLERETIQQRVKDNYYKRGEQGRFLGGTVPYGFDKDKIILEGKKVPVLVENEEQKNVIIKMFEMYAYTSSSLGDICRYFNNLGVKSATGKNWDNSKVSRMLRSTIYVKADVDIYNYYKSKGCNIVNPIDDFEGVNACFIYGKREANERRYTNVKDHVLSIALHEGFVDSRTFLKCQYKLDTNKPIKNTGRGKLTYLSGLLKCGYCGYTLSAIKNISGTVYLNCKGKTIQACDRNDTMYLEDIEAVVESQIINKIKELSEVKINVKKKFDNKANEIKIKISKIDEDITVLMDKILLANETLMQYINNKINELDQQKRELLEELQKENNKADDLGDINKVIERAVNFSELDFESKKEISKLLINRIEVKSNKITIRFKI